MPPSILEQPLNLAQWIQENIHLLQPPVGDHRLSTNPLLIQLVGGPNARLDYHVNSTPEVFYQIKGRMLLRTIREEHKPPADEATNSTKVINVFRDIAIEEGDLYLLPPNTPHNPVRFKDSVGLVIEQPRPEGIEDRLQWYCQNCGDMVHEVRFICVQLGEQIKEAVESVDKMEEECRRCTRCGQVYQTKPTEEELLRFNDSAQQASS